MAPDEISSTDAQQAASASLTQEDRDTISEMSNIGMGAAVSTLSALLGQEADLSSPEVTEYNSLAELSEAFPGEDKIFIFSQYTQGFAASIGIVMKRSDAKLLASMMMGTTEDKIEPGPLTDFEKESVIEAFAQMLSASAASMASVVHRPMEMSRPEVMPFESGIIPQHQPRIAEEPFISVAFSIKLADGRAIELVQYTTSSESKTQIAEVLAVRPDNIDSSALSSLNEAELEEALNVLGAELDAEEQAMQSAASAASAQSSSKPGPSNAMQVDPVTVRPVEFASFDNQQQIFGEENKNLSLVMDVSLSLTVELGKTELSIKDVLELTRGSVIELDRVAGEPVDLLANGKLIAKGEVVVIEDNFGLRITSIVSPADRLRGM